MTAGWALGALILICRSVKIKLEHPLQLLHHSVPNQLGQNL